MVTANTPEEYLKPTPTGGNAPLTKGTEVGTPLSSTSAAKIRNAALSNDMRTGGAREKRTEIES